MKLFPGNFTHHFIQDESQHLFSLVNFLPTTLRQLAFAGFIYRNKICFCPQCGVNIDLNSLDKNVTYASNYFRKLHRTNTVQLGKRCAFLLCESGTNIHDLYSSLSCAAEEDKPQWDDAEYPDLIDYTVRLQTFHSWPYLRQAQNSFVTSTTMAKQGFFFSGRTL